jgi:phage host-nuclease inhibitor protein Gam
VDDRIEQLRALIRDAEDIQRMAQRLLHELNDCRGNSVAGPKSKNQLLERGRKPRT